jgi:hypothetical protein
MTGRLGHNSPPSDTRAGRGVAPDGHRSPLKYVGLGIFGGLTLAGFLLATYWAFLSPSATDEKFSAGGSLLVFDHVVKVDDRCEGSGGFMDIHPGAQVVIRDASGKTVGVGVLDSGYVPPEFRDLEYPGTAGACSWNFKIGDIPSGAGPYSVEVAHRGEVTFAEADAKDISLSLR